MFVVGLGGGLLLRRTLRSAADVAAVRRTESPAPTPSPASSQRLPPVADETIDPASRRRAEQQFGDLFRRGYRNFHSERYAQAAEDFQQAVHVAPHLAEGHFYVGEVYRKLFLTEQAEQAYRESLKRMADFRPAAEKLAMLLHERGRFAEVLELLQTMQQQTPDAPFVLGEQAINWLALGQPQRAAELLERYNTQSGRQAWGYAHLGGAREQLGEAEAAERLYREALQIDPNFAVGHHWLGLLLARQGEELPACG